MIFLARKRDDKNSINEGETITDITFDPIPVDNIEYIKLVSSDNCEFIVQKDIAFASKTIQNMLATQGNFLIIELLKYRIC